MGRNDGIGVRLQHICIPGLFIFPNMGGQLKLKINFYPSDLGFHVAGLGFTVADQLQ